MEDNKINVRSFAFPWHKKGMTDLSVIDDLIGKEGGNEESLKDKLCEFASGYMLHGQTMEEEGIGEIGDMHGKIFVDGKPLRSFGIKDMENTVRRIVEHSNSTRSEYDWLSSNGIRVLNEIYGIMRSSMSFICKMLQEYVGNSNYMDLSDDFIYASVGNSEKKERVVGMLFAKSENKPSRKGRKKGEAPFKSFDTWVEVYFEGRDETVNLDKLSLLSYLNLWYHVVDAISRKIEKGVDLSDINGEEEMF